MARYAVAYISTLVVFFGLDLVFLSTIGGKLYKQTLGDVLNPDFKVAPAVAFYLLMMLGILYFVLGPALDEGRWQVAATRGALFGFFTYMTYDLTSQAIIRNWTFGLTITDLIWGTVLTAAAATGGYLITTALKF
jgi:uncharacterized membrane protein